MMQDRPCRRLWLQRSLSSPMGCQSELTMQPLQDIQRGGVGYALESPSSSRQGPSWRGGGEVGGESCPPDRGAQSGPKLSLLLIAISSSNENFSSQKMLSGTSLASKGGRRPIALTNPSAGCLIGTRPGRERYLSSRILTSMGNENKT